jgi:hypothetical protein
MALLGEAEAVDRILAQANGLSFSQFSSLSSPTLPARTMPQALTFIIMSQLS